MRVLVTGGSGVIGTSAVSELLSRGHAVRLLSRHADDEAKRWSGVEPFPADVTDSASLGGACDDCDAVLHIAGIVDEEPPEKTYAAVNVGGTRNILNAAQNATVHAFVYVSSLGAERGSSDYHRSKLEAESHVRHATLPWTIVRPGNVYGPRDELISQILKMMRALPAIPVVDAGDEPFQPLWHEDLAKALVTTIERDDLRGQILEVAAPDATTIDDVITRLSKIIDRKPLRVPVPNVLTSAVASGAAAARVPFPISESKLQMLREESVLRGANALAKLAVAPTALDEGLKRLVDELPEQLPESGVGALKHKRFFVTISQTPLRAAAVMTKFRESFTDIIPLDFAAEPHATKEIEPGNTLTMKLPLRGNAQVRIEAVEATRILLVTVEGHPLAGAVQFSTADHPDGVEFAIDTYTRSANFFDWVAMNTAGAPLQDANWKHVVEKVADLAGGRMETSVQSSSETLDEEAAQSLEKTLHATIQSRLRDESAEDVAQR